MFEQLLDLNPGQAYAYLGKGNALLGLKRTEEALTTFDRARELAPEDAYLYCMWGSPWDASSAMRKRSLPWHRRSDLIQRARKATG